MTVELPTIAFLHTSPAHVATFTTLLARPSPGTRSAHVVDEALHFSERQDLPPLVSRVY